MRLNEQNLLCTRVALGSGGDKGERADKAQKPFVVRFGQVKRNDMHGFGRAVGKGAALTTLKTQTLHVNISDSERVFAGKAFVFGERTPVFVNACVA